MGVARDSFFKKFVATKTPPRKRSSAVRKRPTADRPPPRPLPVSPYPVGGAHRSAGRPPRSPERGQRSIRGTSCGYKDFPELRTNSTCHISGTGPRPKTPVLSLSIFAVLAYTFTDLARVLVTSKMKNKTFILQNDFFFNF